MHGRIKTYRVVAMSDKGPLPWAPLSSVAMTPRPNVKLLLHS